MTLQAIATLSNRESLFIGEITAREAEIAQAENPDFDGFGLYLLAVDNCAPSAPAKVLAKFSSEDAALTLAQFFRASGLMMAA